MLDSFVEPLTSDTARERLGLAFALHPHLRELWSQLVVWAIQLSDLDLNLIHRDVTSLHFSGAYSGSELVCHCHSREHRPHIKSKESSSWW